MSITALRKSELIRSHARSEGDTGRLKSRWPSSLSGSPTSPNTSRPTRRTTTLAGACSSWSLSAGPARSPEAFRRRTLHGPDRHAGPAPLKPEARASRPHSATHKRGPDARASNVRRPPIDRHDGADTAALLLGAVPYAEGSAAILIPPVDLERIRKPGPKSHPPLSAPHGNSPVGMKERARTCSISNASP